MGIIIAVNTGSSSVKLSAYTHNGNAPPTQIAHGEVASIGEDKASMEYSRQGESAKKESAKESGKSHEAAFVAIVGRFVKDPKLHQIQDKKDIGLICHRIVHGGDYEGLQIITEQAYQRLESLVDLAPLHNASAMQIVRCCFKLIPDSKNVACFDTQFHKTIPKHIATYPIDQEVASRHGLRKYGFHGLSYGFIVRQTAQYLKKDIGELNIIALHLGSGASACAIEKGRSLDTSMGLTPLSGLPGATRSGSVDPRYCGHRQEPRIFYQSADNSRNLYSLIFHYTSSVGNSSSFSPEDLPISRAEEILNKESGWAALTGTKNFEEIAKMSDESHRLAFNLFVDRICSFVGSYFVSLRGQVDALVFAGGIGEKSSRLRDAVIHGVGCLGFSVDSNANNREMLQTVEEISHAAAERKVLVCQVDEQFEMVRLCGNLAIE